MTIGLLLILTIAFTIAWALLKDPGPKQLCMILAIIFAAILVLVVLLQFFGGVGFLNEQIGSLPTLSFGLA